MAGASADCVDRLDCPSAKRHGAERWARKSEECFDGCGSGSLICGGSLRMSFRSLQGADSPMQHELRSVLEPNFNFANAATFRRTIGLDATFSNPAPPCRPIMSFAQPCYGIRELAHDVDAYQLDNLLLFSNFPLVLSSVVALSYNSVNSLSSLKPKRE